MKEIIQVVERVTGRKVPIREEPRRPGDPAVLVADITQAKNLLAFAPHFNDIELIVETAWRWYQHHH